MEIKKRKLEIEFEHVAYDENDEIPVFGVCAYDMDRVCMLDCTAIAIMAIPRTRLIKDSTLGQYTVVADREPIVGPFCRRGGFPLGLHADENTVCDAKKKGSDVSIG